MSFDSLIEDGIRNVYENDLDTQKHYISILLEETRGMTSIETVLRADAFFVPNNEYMKVYFGSEVTDPSYDIYGYNGLCNWDNNIVFPIRNVVGKAVGLLGYNPFRKLLKNEKQTAENHYRYSSKDLFNRGKYLFMLKGVYEKAIEDGYLVITDGGFDMLSFADNGINAASALGSGITPEIIFQLRFIKNIFVAEDNDDAGRRLYDLLKRSHPRVHYMRQSMFKDADDTIKGSIGPAYLDMVRRAISTSTGFSLRTKPKMYSN